MIAALGRTVFFSALIALALWFAWMMADNEPPYIYDQESSRIAPDPAPQGAMVTADWNLKKVNRVCPGTVQRFFRDANTKRMVATLDTTEVSRAVKVGDNSLPRSFQLPPNLPARVEYSALVCFECNPLQQRFPLCIMTPTITFGVLQ